MPKAMAVGAMRFKPGAATAIPLAELAYLNTRRPFIAVGLERLKGKEGKREGGKEGMRERGKEGKRE